MKSLSTTFTKISLRCSLFVVSVLLLISSTPLLLAAPGDRDISFNYLLLHSIILENGVFEKEVFLDNIPDAAKKQVFRLRMEGRNYVLGVLPQVDSSTPTMSTGSFDGKAWETSGKNLIISDPNMNSGRTPTDALEATTRLTANTFLNFGIPEFVRNGAIWDNDKNSFVAPSTDGGEVVVELEGDSQAPIKATIRSSRFQGEALAYVRYEYEQSFYEGKVPIKFTRFAAGAPNEDVGKTFTVRVRNFELSTESLSADSFDPQLLFKELAAESTIFYSNDSPYFVRSSVNNGKPQKVLTSEEYYKTMQALVRNASTEGPSNINFIRFTMAVFFILSAAICGLLIIRRKQQKTYEDK